MSATPFTPRFMEEARKVAESSNCRRRKVGAVLTKGNVILSGASNGTPPGMKRCDEGGCPRCLSNARKGDLYESCLCIHAEQRVIAGAASAGLSTAGGLLYCTLRPCLTCVKLCLLSGITTIVYDEDIMFSPEVEQAYRELIQQTRLVLVKWPMVRVVESG